MFDDDGNFSLLLGTSKRIFSTDILHAKNIPIYLASPPYDNSHPLLDNFTIIAFLSSFDDDLYTFSQTKEKTEVKIDGKTFTNYKEISRLSTKLFKLRYQKSGNNFVIQILNNHQLIKYRDENIKLKKNIVMFIFSTTNLCSMKAWFRLFNIKKTMELQNCLIFIIILE